MPTVSPCGHYTCHLEGAIPCDGFLLWKRQVAPGMRANEIAQLRIGLLDAVRSAPPELLARLRELVDLWPAA